MQTLRSMEVPVAIESRSLRDVTLCRWTNGSVEHVQGRHLVELARSAVDPQQRRLGAYLDPGALDQFAAPILIQGELLAIVRDQAVAGAGAAAVDRSDDQVVLLESVGRFAGRRG